MNSLNHSFHKQAISRRSFLRGAGVALALPWLESFPTHAADIAASTASSVLSKPPVRFACIYFSNGVEPIHWDRRRVEPPDQAADRRHRLEFITVNATRDQQVRSRLSAFDGLGFQLHGELNCHGRPGRIGLERKHRPATMLKLE